MDLPICKCLDNSAVLATGSNWSMSVRVPGSHSGGWYITLPKGPENEVFVIDIIGIVRRYVDILGFGSPDFGRDVAN
eukprot:scaffold99755_cov62-Attheya_sp.AAC.1